MAAAEPKLELPDVGFVPGATRLVDECYHYTEADQIGEGTYGKVYKGKDRNGDVVALKMIRMDNEKEGFPITAIREIKLLSTLKHENIVNLREIVRSKVTKESKYKGDIFMVFDYAAHDLTGMQEATKSRGGLNKAQVKCVMVQLLRGLAYCHKNGILHRDLKASNLLINKDGVLKIADFGLARNYNDEQGKLTNRVITLWYRPPELLLGAERYGPEVDVWSCGCIFAELLSKKPLFPGNNEQQQLDYIFKLMGAPSEENWPGVSGLEFFKNVKTGNYKKGPDNFDDWCKRHEITDKEAIELLKSMLSLDPAKRIKSEDAALHSYFFTSQPPACDPKDLPAASMADCHEWTTKKRKQQQHQQQQQQQQYGHHAGYHQGHHAGYGHAAGHHGAPHHGSGMPGPGGHHYMPGDAVAAAAGGYGSGQQRNVRPRTSGGGSAGQPQGPAGAAAAAAGRSGYGGHRQQGYGGFNPTAAPRGAAAGYPGQPPAHHGGFAGPMAPPGPGAQQSYGPGAGMQRGPLPPQQQQQQRTQAYSGYAQQQQRR